MGVRYLGGKDELLRLGLREQLVTRARACGCRRFFDVFCGSAKVTVAMEELGVPRYASDLSSPIVSLLLALQHGWLPPTSLSHDLWKALRQQARTLKLLKAEAGPVLCDPIIAFAGFACSRNGAFFRGFQYEASAVESAARSAVRLGEQLQGVHIRLADYRSAWPGLTELGPGDVVYCDIPFGNTEGYATTPKFDMASFWRWAQKLTRRGVLVLVSEYAAPPAALEVWRCERVVRVRQLNAQRKGDRTVIEKLYEVRA